MRKYVPCGLGKNIAKTYLFTLINYVKKTINLIQNCDVPLKVHKIENFFGSDFEFCTISLLVMLKY